MTDGRTPKIKYAVLINAIFISTCVLLLLARHTVVIRYIRVIAPLFFIFEMFFVFYLVKGFRTNLRSNIGNNIKNRKSQNLFLILHIIGGMAFFIPVILFTIDLAVGEIAFENILVVLLPLLLSSYFFWQAWKLISN